MRKLTKRERDFLQRLYDDKDLEYRGCIRKFLIRHTYTPKHKIGDFVKITDDTFSYIWGCRIVNVKCKIDEINWWLNDKGQEYVQYCCTAIDQFGKEHLVIAEESIHGYYEKRHITGVCKDNKNVFDKKSQYSDSTSVEW